MVIHLTDERWSPVEEAYAVMTSAVNRFGQEPWLKDFGEGMQAVARCAQHLVDIESRKVRKLKIPEEAAEAFKKWVAGTGHKLAQVREWLERVNIPPDLANLVAKGELAISAAQLMAGQDDGNLRLAMAARVKRSAMSVLDTQNLARLIGDW